MSNRLEHNTYVLRSAAAGMNCVNFSLNTGRAITLCCTANISSRRASMTKAGKNDIRAAESIDFGTYRFPMNPTAYTNVRKNAK